MQYYFILDSRFTSQWKKYKAARKLHYSIELMIDDEQKVMPIPSKFATMPRQTTITEP